MNICFFIRDLKIEGVQVVTLRLATEIAKHGHSTTLLTLKDNKDLDVPSSIHLESLSINEAFNNNSLSVNRAIFIEWLNRKEAMSKFDVIISSHGETIKMTSFEDPRFIVYIHNSDEYTYKKKNWYKKYRFRQKLKKELSNRHILTVSKGIEYFIKDILPNTSTSVTTLYNPFDIDSLKVLGNIPIQPDNKQRGKYIIFVGRLVKQKRVDRLIEALSLLADKDINLLIIGEGELKKNLLNYAKELEIESRITFSDFMDNPYPLMKQAEMLVLSSDHEGLPTVLIESLILETPVVSTDCPSGPSEILEGFLDQNLVREVSAINLAHTIDKALINDQPICYSKGYDKYSSLAIYTQLMNYLIEIKAIVK